MKTEFLKELGIEAEAITKIMAENGKDIEREKAKAEASRAEVEALKTSNAELAKKLEAAGDTEKLKKELADWQAKAKEVETESQAKLQKLEREALVKDFVADKKFANEITKEAIVLKLSEALGSEDAKGKAIADIFKGLIDGKENILLDESKPQPPKTVQMGASVAGDDPVTAAFKKINPNIKLD